MREDDELVGVRLSDGDDDLLMVSREGQAIRFHESDVRAMGRAASGVRGMKLRGDDEVIEVNIAEDDADLLVVTENGYGKRTRALRVPGQGPRRAGRQDGAAHRGEGQARRRARRARRLPGDADLDGRHGDPDAGRRHQAAGRSTQGVIVMRLREGEQRLEPRAGGGVEPEETAMGRTRPIAARRGGDVDAPAEDTAPPDDE